TETNILNEAVELMTQRFGSRPEDMIAVLSPCIRPPHYEVDFATEIGRQAEASGIGEFSDCGLNTAEDLERFYSYRIEQGKTGRMMAMMMRE
ncbi:MAG: laccase domain-containing protein, partial [Akkermansiaceae bacterium]|nr:laccase domain-containing protein [Akkermansiaceae bacterium]